MFFPARRPGKGSSGFSLVEMLVAMAILLLILSICLAFTFTAQSVLTNGMQRMDADEQARLFFDRITVDLASMAKRNDIDYIVKDDVQTQTGNDSLAFYAGVSGYFSSSADPAPRPSMALLAYRINSQTYQLERLAKGIGWNTNSSNTPMVFLPATLAATWPAIAGVGAGGVPNLTLGTDADYQVLGDGIFRLEYCYIMRDGTLSNVPWLKPPHTALNGWQDVVALYVAIAVLDDRSRLLVPRNAAGNPQLAMVTNALLDFRLGAGQPYPPLTQWQTSISGTNFRLVAGLSIKAASAVRIFARSIPINNFPPDLSL